jgi:hypothetical protein
MFLFKEFRLLLIAALLVISSMYSCSPRLTINSLWQADSPDLKYLTTWIQQAEYDERSKLHIQLSNDKENLYVLLQTDDDLTKMKMLRAGMELSIDTLGKREGHCSLVFPIRQETMMSALVPIRNRGEITEGDTEGFSERRQRFDGENQRKRPDQAEMFQRLIDQQRHAMIHGFNNHRDGRTSIDSDNGIRVVLTIDTTGMMSYRAVLPLYTFYKELETAADTTRKFGLTVHISGIEAPQRPAGGLPGGGNMRPDQGRPGTPGGSGRTMPGQSGMGGGRYTASSQPSGIDRKDMAKDQVVRMIFYLSFQ